MGGFRWAMLEKALHPQNTSSHTADIVTVVVMVLFIVVIFSLPFFLEKKERKHGLNPQIKTTNQFTQSIH